MSITVEVGVTVPPIGYPRRVGRGWLPLAAVLVGCPDSGGSDAADDGSTGGSGVTSGASTQPSDSGNAQGPAGSGSGPASGSSTGPPGVMCGDGQADEGEVCFLDPVVIPTAAPPTELALGTFTDAQGPDLAFSTAAAVVIAPRDAAQFFAPLDPVPTLPDARIAVADFDQDGIDDVVSMAANAGRVLFIVPEQMPVSLNVDPLAEDVTAVAATDVGGDEAPDLVLVGQSAMAPVVETRIAAGSSFMPGELVSLPVPGVEIVAGRLDGDADELGDFAVGHADPATLAGYRGAAGGGFEAPVGRALSGPLTAMALGDVNGDGAADVLAGLPSVGLVAVALGEMDGPAPVAEWPAGAQPGRLTTADLNGDTIADIAVVSGSSIALLMGTDGAGGFDVPVTLETSDPAIDVVAADLNDDGLADLIVATDIDLRVYASDP